MELQLRSAIPAFINSFNQPTYLRDTVEWFHKHGFRNIVVLDNGSTSSVLLDYLARPEFSEKARVQMLGDNLGPRKSISYAVENCIGFDAPFIFTDPDLLLPENPDEKLVSRLFEIGTRYGVLKVGLALDVSEPHLFKPLTVKMRKRVFSIQKWEKRFWRNRLEDGVYRAAIDTTFFLHIPGRVDGKRFGDWGTKQPKMPAIRVAGEGFTAKHRPWYENDGMPEDERLFYRETASRMASWLRDAKKVAESGVEEPAVQPLPATISQA